MVVVIDRAPTYESRGLDHNLDTTSRGLGGTGLMPGISHSMSPMAKRPQHVDTKDSPMSAMGAEPSRSTRLMPPAMKLEEWEVCFEEQATRIFQEALAAVQLEHRKLVKQFKVHAHSLRHQYNSDNGDSSHHSLDVDVAVVEKKGNGHAAKYLGEHLEILDLDATAHVCSSAFETEVSNAEGNKMERDRSRAVTYSILKEWTQASQEQTEDRPFGVRKSGSMIIEEDDATETTVKPYLVQSPNSNVRLVWDFLAALCLIAELCLVPMSVFDMDDTKGLFAFRVVVMFYWTADVGANFFAGYYLHHGEVELRFRVVARRYLTSWFMPDVSLVIIDWLTYGAQLVEEASDGLTESMQPLKVLRLGKFARIARVIRVLIKWTRLLKLPMIVARIDNSVGMERAVVLFGIAKNLVMILMLNHFLACAWYWIGSADAGWVSLRSSPHWGDDYAWAMYWSVANFTPGTSGVQPQTTREVVFAVFVLFFAMVCFSVFVSSTTSLIHRFAVMHYAQRRNMLKLKRFLRQHNVPITLRSRVVRYVKVALDARRDIIPKGEVELLTILSIPLKEEIQMNLHLSTLGVHPLFKYLAVANTSLMRKVSSEALFEVAYSRGDVLFSAGEIADKMGFIVSGVLDYNPGQRYMREDGQPWLLGPTDSFCEAVLWTRWKCRGMMTSDVESEVIELSSGGFRRCIQRNHIVLITVQGYAHAFIEVLNSASSGDLAEPLTDVHTGFLTEAPIQVLFG